MPFRPFSDVQVSLGSLQEEMNKFFDRVMHSGVSAGPFDGQEWGPPLDLYEEDERFRLLMELPGVDPAHVEVTHVGKTLSIRGEKLRPSDVGTGGKAVRTERRYGSFCRTLDLPEDIDPDQLTARCRGGVLEVIIPKSETAKPRSVRITAEEGA
ncbi:MAG: Hsp20/alpha crystallin family protein [Phycisphaerae bacterium]|nr:Hsp20/alpha crystallin family protein [Phycisphaerae bacterium]